MVVWSVGSVLAVRVLVAVAFLQESFGLLVNTRIVLKRLAQGFERIAWHKPSLCLWFEIWRPMADGRRMVFSLAGRLDQGYDRAL